MESEHITPAEKELSAREVQTLYSKEKVPIAESTRKDVKEFKDKDRQESQIDFLEGEPRQRVPTKEIQTPRRRLSFREESDDDTTEEIDREIKETEIAQQELEKREDANREGKNLFGEREAKNCRRKVESFDATKKEIRRFNYKNEQ